VRDRAAHIAANVESGPIDRLKRRRRCGAHWHIGRKSRRSGQQRKRDDADRDPHWLLSFAPPK
jgi:hypothetical protein